MKEIVSQPTNGVICEDGKIAKNGLRVICPFCGEIGLSQGRGGSVNVWTVGAIERRECTKCRKQFHTIALAQDAISNIESGARLVMDYELRAFASVLQVPIEDLLDPEEE